MSEKREIADQAGKVLKAKGEFRFLRQNPKNGISGIWFKKWDRDSEIGISTHQNQYMRAWVRRAVTQTLKNSVFGISMTSMAHIESS